MSVNNYHRNLDNGREILRDFIKLSVSNDKVYSALSLVICVSKRRGQEQFHLQHLINSRNETKTM